MKLSAWCKKVGLSYQTGWNLWKTGKLPVKAYQIKTGTIIVEENSTGLPKNPYVVVYARVSSSENKPNLDTQASRLVHFANANGLIVSQVVKEIGSGLNDKRKKLLKILTEGKATHLIVEHKDRLSRFGTEYIKLLCNQQNCQLIIINDAKSDKEDLIADFVAIITSFCARIYGQRRSKRNTEALIQKLELQNVTNANNTKSSTIRSKEISPAIRRLRRALLKGKKLSKP